MYTLSSQPPDTNAPPIRSPKVKKVPKRRLSSMRGQQYLVIITFMACPLILLFLFTYLPFLLQIKFSFYSMQYLGPRTFVGLQNYRDVFVRPDIFSSLRLMVFYLLASVVQLSLALVLASILSFHVRGGNIFKGIIFFPYLVSGIAIGFMFKFFFTHGYVFDTVLTAVGFNLKHLPYWLLNTSVNNFSLAGTSVWRYLGQNMVLFIGAIMSVDPALYEAAAIDGANSWARFRHIILPSIKTIVVLNLILSISGSISAFEPPYVITNGTFGTGTYFVVMDHIAHVDQKVGLASAMAVILMAIIVLVTVFQDLVVKVFLTEDENGMTFRERSARRRRLRAN